MRWRLAAVVLLSVFVVPGIAQAQAKKPSKSGRYHVRLTVQGASVETFESHRDEGQSHDKSNGTARINLSYAQNFLLTVNDGFVSLDQTEGPADSSVTSSVSADSMNSNGNGSPLHYTLAMESSPNPQNVEDSGSGTGTAVTLQAFALNGEGLAVRFDAKAQIKGKCTTNIPTVPDACLAPMLFQHSVEGSAGPNTAPHTEAAPQAMDISSTFDVSSQSAAECPSCLTGATAKGDLNSGYVLTYDSSAPEAKINGVTFNWHVTVSARITILGPA
jgi:hypothetical protein